MGQFKMSAADKKEFDSLVRAPLTVPPSHTNCCDKDSVWEPTFKVARSGGSFTGTPTKTVIMPPKDSITKGWIKYYTYRMEDEYSAPGSVSDLTYKPPRKTLAQVFEPATAHYRATSAFRVINPNGVGSWQADWSLYKIEVDGKPFDLSKYYQFIPENQVVE